MIDSLLGNHDSESVEVGEVLLGLTGGDLLGPGSLVPGIDDPRLSKDLLNDSGARTSADIDLEVCQRKPADRDQLLLNSYNVFKIYRKTKHTGNILGTIDNNLGTINDIDDDASFATVRSVCDQTETTSLNETLKHVFK